MGQNAPERRRETHRALKGLKKLVGDARSVGAVIAVREPDNAYDDMAVAVYLREPRIKLGYIPRKHSWICEAMDGGKAIDIQVERIKREGLLKRRYLVDLRVSAFNP